MLDGDWVNYKYILENRLNTLSKIDIPTLVIHGTEDPLIPIDHGKKNSLLDK